jgi:hypothetical protein
MEWELAREMEVIGEYLYQVQFVKHKRHIIWDWILFVVVGYLRIADC